MDPMLAITLPGGAIVFALLGLATNKFASWRFDQKHPHLSRKRLREADAQVSSEQVLTTSTKTPDEADTALNATANQNSQCPFSSPKGVLNTVLSVKDIERLKMGEVVLTGSSVVPSGRAPKLSNILPPRPTPRSRRDESASTNRE